MTAPASMPRSASAVAAAVEARSHRRSIVMPLGWAELSAASLEANPFFSPAIAAASFAHLGDGSERLAIAQSGGRLVALAPVKPMRLGRLVPAVGVWTHLYAPLGTPLLDAADPQTAVMRLVGEMAREQGERSVLLFPDLPVEGETARLIERLAAVAGRPVARIGVHRRAVLSGSAEGAPIAQRIDRRRRKEFARQWRRLAERGEIEQRRVLAGSELERSAQDFLKLEASGWKGRGGTALNDDPASRGFALAAITGSPPESVAIDEIRLDGVPVAMLVGFRAGQLAVTWKIAHDEAMARFSPGVQVMLAASDAWLAEPGLASIDSLAAPDHPMIDGLWDERMAVGLLAVGPVGGSALFTLGVRLAEAEFAARQWLRRRRRRRAVRPTHKE